MKYGPNRLDAKLTLDICDRDNNKIFNLNELNWENAQYILTFRELEFLTSFLLTEFLTLNHSWISCK